MNKFGKKDIYRIYFLNLYRIGGILQNKKQPDSK